ncbi:MAG: hypothetical protein ACK47B_02020 [Armatimonadota bacterium]
MLRRAFILSAAALALGTAASAQLQEIYSQYVRVLNPQGDFAAKLIRLEPGGGEGWREVRDERNGYRLQVPAGAKVDTAASGSRVLLVTLEESQEAPSPTFRIDLFQPAPGEPTKVDAEYARAYAEQYSETAFEGKLQVTDSGLLQVKKLPLAMVGGVRPQGAAQAYRLQCAHLSKKQQLFLTVDCSAADWPGLSETVGRMLLTFEVGK